MSETPGAESVIVMREKRQAEYNRVLNELDDVTNNLTTLLTVPRSKVLVVEYHKAFLTLYDQYLTAEQNLYRCLPAEDQGFHGLLFASKRRDLRDLQKSVENYFSTSIDPGDSASQISGKTYRSKSSNNSRLSKTSMLRLQEEQQKAEISVRSAALEEKFQLDLQKKRFEMESELQRCNLRKGKKSSG